MILERQFCQFSIKPMLWPCECSLALLCQNCHRGYSNEHLVLPTTKVFMVKKAKLSLNFHQTPTLFILREITIRALLGEIWIQKLEIHVSTCTSLQLLHISRQ